MPNICNNWIKITGNNTSLEKLMSQPFELELYCPIPENTINIDEWIDENWGSKWIENNIIFIYSKNSIETFFNSAWFPPLAFYFKLIELLPDIIIEFEYSGFMMTFVGHGSLSFNKITNVYEHYTYDSVEEFNSINNCRDWNLNLFNPTY